MKNLRIIGLVVASLIIMQACNTAALKSIKAETKNDSASYMIGVSVGHSIKSMDLPDVHADLILKGIMEALEDDSATTGQEANMFLQKYMGELSQLKASENIEKGKKFLEENKTLSGVVETESGLQYKIITEGTGKAPVATDKVKCHYRGTLLNGDEFDSSYKRGQPAEFGLNGVIPGWTEGLQLVKEGGKIELYIPSDLAYGERGGGQMIGPNETLIFEIELLEVISE